MRQELTVEFIFEFLLGCFKELLKQLFQEEIEFFSEYRIKTVVHKASGVDSYNILQHFHLHQIETFLIFFILVKVILFFKILMKKFLLRETQIW